MHLLKRGVPSCSSRKIFTVLTSEPGQLYYISVTVPNDMYVLHCSLSRNSVLNTMHRLLSPMFLPIPLPSIPDNTLSAPFSRYTYIFLCNIFLCWKVIRFWRFQGRKFSYNIYSLIWCYITMFNQIILFQLSSTSDIYKGDILI